MTAEDAQRARDAGVVRQPEPGVSERAARGGDRCELCPRTPPPSLDVHLLADLQRWPVESARARHTGWSASAAVAGIQDRRPPVAPVTAHSRHALAHEGATNGRSANVGLRERRHRIVCRRHCLGSRELSRPRRHQNRRDRGQGDDLRPTHHFIGWPWRPQDPSAVVRADARTFYSRGDRRPRRARPARRAGPRHVGGRR